jgi:hypothetical protein
MAEFNILFNAGSATYLLDEYGGVYKNITAYAAVSVNDRVLDCLVLWHLNSK